ncbi:peptidoglycan-binding protein [Planotetraspora phitsanulokensis]|uniref:Peptidoglycan-binding protein n=1 Tax=Planotetraspora phitsanulokensis TaxID=575192 RepID=A0A8J3U0H7_9ACTN|nr:peptidoglycan-binding protein [Planotetraspora phitsanulokensis]GII35657.1 peptidoglycan-binding protein [Planotetraspora phitsanulokensis]
MTSRSGARRRGRAGAVAGTVVLAAGAATAAAVGFGGGGMDTPTAADLPPDTAQVTRQTMSDTDEVPGDLGYSAEATLAGRIAGVVTKVPLAGDVVRRGRPIYRVDNRPVVLMYGAVAAYRTLAPGVTGADVRQLEENLKALGYGGFTVDNTYTALTATAVRRWQKDLRLSQTGQVEQGRVLFAPGKIRVDSVTTGVNQSTGGGQEVLRYTGTGRQITVQLEVAKQRLARKGVKVQVQMPDGKKVAGRVKRVYTVVEQPTDPGSQAETRIEAIVSLDDPAAATGIEAAVVNVVFTAAERKDVLTVPVAALVALAEGGYGVEVVEGSTTRYIKVETGLFANGRVEITGDGLNEGMTVGTPQ